MTDLTLDQFREMSKEELKKILKEEARKIFGSDSTTDNCEPFQTRTPKKGVVTPAAANA